VSAGFSKQIRCFGHSEIIGRVSVKRLQVIERRETDHGLSWTCSVKGK